MSPTPAAGAVPEAMGTGEPLLLRALTGERTASPPVWFMRQAGRSLPEYRALRVGTRMLEACLTPDLAAEITVQPVRRHGVDAAIFFSDIVVPLRLAGVEVEIEPGRGPVFADPVRTAADVDRLTRINPDDVAAAGDPVAVAVRTVVQELGPSVPVIGFAGAPFTLASYLVEGGPSKDQLRARAMMHADPAAWDRLAGWLAQVARAFLTVQTGAGARAVQLFDSWAGTLSADDYRRFVAPHSRAALAGVEAPRVHFGVNTGHLLAEMRLEGTASAVGVDWRTPLDEAVGVLGPEAVVQGNIDPALLRAPWSVLEAHVADVVRRGSTAAAHILNLGHGVPPDTDPDVLTRIVEFVHGRMP